MIGEENQLLAPTLLRSQLLTLLYRAVRRGEMSKQDAERRLDDLFGTGHTLAVYGTLAPGRPNHHVLAPLGGAWTDGLIEGDLIPLGWGAALGYPGFRPRAGGDNQAPGPPPCSRRARHIRR